VVDTAGQDDDSPAEEPTILERIQFPASEHLLPLLHHQLVKTGNTMPQGWEEVSSHGIKSPHFALN
jgi:hypothetical protein